MVMHEAWIGGLVFLVFFSLLLKERIRKEKYSEEGLRKHDINVPKESWKHISSEEFLEKYPRQLTSGIMHLAILNAQKEGRETVTVEDIELSGRRIKNLVSLNLDLIPYRLEKKDIDIEDALKSIKSIEIPYKVAREIKKLSEKYGPTAGDLTFFVLLSAYNRGDIKADLSDLKKAIDIEKTLHNTDLSFFDELKP